MGAAALVMTEATAVSAEGRISHKCLGLYCDDNEAALGRVIEFCRRHGVTALGIQLAHAGRKASTHPPAAGGGPLGTDQGAWTALAPSAVAFAADWHVPEAVDAEAMARIKAEFAAAATRAARIGFDLDELHYAHGYLVHEFLSPIANRRTDGYGGSLANRLRYPLEVFEAVRAVWPADKPLGVRVSATDWVAGGWTPEETVVLARELSGLGCDFVDVSSGGMDPGQQIPLGPGYQVPLAAKLRAEAGIATMAVGMITEPQQAEDIVASGGADMVALARGMMYDPRWAWRAAEALGADTAYAPGYVRCQPSRRPEAFPNRRAAE